MKKLILFAMIASTLVGTSARSMVRPGKNQWPPKHMQPILNWLGPILQQQLFAKLKPKLKKLGVNIDTIRSKATRQKLILRGLNRAQTINMITFYASLRMGIAELKKKISLAQKKFSTWGWVLPPKIKAKIINNLKLAKELKPYLEGILNQLKTQYHKLEKLKL